MKALLRLLAMVALLGTLQGCEKDSTKPDPSGALEPKIFLTDPTYKEEGKSVNVSVSFAWTTENTIKATMENSSIKTPKGDTTISMKKGETKILAFIVENADGIKKYQYLKVIAPSEPVTPTISASFTYNDQMIDTLPYLGGDVKVKVIFSNGVLELNGVMYENSPVVFNFTVSETKTYDFKVVGPGGEITLSFIVPVYIPVGYEMFIIDPYWKRSKLEFQDAFGFPWVEHEMSECTKDDLMKFSLIPSRFVVCDYGEILCGGENKISKGSWSLSGTFITVGDNDIYEILTINSDTLIWVSQAVGTQTRVKETFVRN